MPKRYNYMTVDVFTDRAFAGNPLGVVTDASGLTPEQMQAIAAEFNYSESTFVLPPDEPSHTARVRIFTRQNEIPFAGHPNVGTAFAIALVAERRGQTIGSPVVFEEAAGLVPVDLLRDTGRVTGATLTAPQPLTLGKTIPAAIVAECVGLEPAAVLTSGHEPIIASVGLPFVIAEVAGDALGAARPDTVAFSAAARRFPFEAGRRFCIHLYARTAGGKGQRDLRARMFSPLGGTVEDPATGSANGALVALLASLEPAANATVAFDILQGAEMGRPSRLAVSAEKQGGSIVRVRVGGRCAPVMEGTLTV